MKEPVAFSKAQILTMQRYAGRVDILSVLLTDKKTYSLEGVDKTLEQFMKGKVR